MTNFGPTTDAKIIVMIPCLNEEEGLSKLVPRIPKTVLGLRVKILVIDDGSCDNTSALALDLGCDYLVRHRQNRGLAAAFQSGISAAVELRADYIVNIDADGQYRPEDISLLLAPLVDGTADVTIGDRQTRSIEQFSYGKRIFQRFGSWCVSRLAGRQINDAVSGFRGFTRESALRVAVLSAFSYTTETIISLSLAGFKTCFVPVNTEVVSRQSRLARSSSQFVLRQAITIIRAVWMERPLLFFTRLGFLFFFVGSVPFLRFIYYYFQGIGEGFVQSLIFGSVMLGFAFSSFLLGIIGDLLSVNRRLTLLVFQGLRAGSSNFFSGVIVSNPKKS